MGHKLHIRHIHGLSELNFSNFKNIDLELALLDEGIKAQSLPEKVLEYIYIASITFPFDFVRDIIKDATKEALYRTSEAIVSVWNGLKDKEYATVTVGREPEIKKPKIRLAFPISEKEVSIFEISNEVSDKTLKTILPQYFDLLKVQTENRKKEMDIENKLPVEIKTSRK